MFRGNARIGVQDVVWSSVVFVAALTGLFLYAVKKSVIFPAVMEAVAVLFLLRIKSGRMVFVISRATHTLITMVAFFKHTSMLICATFPMTTLLILNNPLLILTAKNKKTRIKIVMRRMSGDFFLLSFLIFSGSVAGVIAALYLLVSFFLFLSDIATLRKNKIKG